MLYPTLTDSRVRVSLVSRPERVTGAVIREIPRDAMRDGIVYRFARGAVSRGVASNAAAV